MLGWWISVKTLSPEERESLVVRRDSEEPYVLAHWEAWVNGLHWLEIRVADGRAQKVKSEGYPNRYLAKAADILPVIREPKEWMRNLVHHPVNIAKCDPETVLTIDAWDLS